MTAPLHIVWFKRDLRVADHRPLAHAAAMGPTLPLYVVEPDWWQGPDMSARQWAFVRESVIELDRALKSLGQPLIVRTGQVTEVLANLHRTHGIAALYAHEETGNAWTYARDRAVAAWCRAHAVPWHETPQSGVIRRIASRDGWARRWDSFMAEDVTAPPALAPLTGIDSDALPTASDLGLAPDPCPERQTGGRADGRATLTSFLETRGAPYRSAMSSPVTGFEACSRLSPHLAWGTLAMREVAQATRARQRELKALGKRDGWRGAMRSFSGRLHWRDHFTQKLEDAPRIEHRNFHSAYDGLRPATPDKTRLDAWAAGETGLPFVDACMRALIATGWMNFRMRAMLMATASYHLWLEWQAPGQQLARLFTDYEPGIHWPQVQMQSGTTGINTIRIYNPVKQGHDQDPTGVFTRQWLPELADVPDAHLQDPWTWEGAGKILDRTYPRRIIDHLDAAKEARVKIWAARRGPAFRAEADTIQAQHGSRKSGIPMTGAAAGSKSEAKGTSAKGARRKRSANPDQLTLSLGDGG